MNARGSVVLDYIFHTKWRTTNITNCFSLHCAWVAYASVCHCSTWLYCFCCYNCSNWFKL